MTETETETCSITRYGKTMDFPAELENKIRKWLEIPRQVRPYCQDHFPELNADQREFLISGTTPEEWERLFGGDEE